LTRRGRSPSADAAHADPADWKRARPRAPPRRPWLRSPAPAPGRRIPPTKRVSGPSAPASTRAMIRSTRLQLCAPSKNSMKRRSLPSRGAASNLAFVPASRPSTLRRHVEGHRRPFNPQTLIPQTPAPGWSRRAAAKAQKITRTQPSRARTRQSAALSGLACPAVEPNTRAGLFCGSASRNSEARQGQAAGVGTAAKAAEGRC
jgi:hypothetical protein